MWLPGTIEIEGVGSRMTPYNDARNGRTMRLLSERLLWTRDHHPETGKALRHSRAFLPLQVASQLLTRFKACEVREIKLISGYVTVVEREVSVGVSKIHAHDSGAIIPG